MSPLPPSLAIAAASAGATAEVFRASCEGADVALKVGRDSTVAPILAGELEALILAAGPLLPRPRAAGWVVIDGDVARGVAADAPGARPAIAVEWVPGTPLVERERSADASLALIVARDVGAALGALHLADLAHGDLSASNVLVEAARHARIVDLGLTTSRYETHVRGGTPRYLARGDADLGTAEQRDLLALGLLLAEIAEPSLRDAGDLVTRARSANLPHPLGEICTALLAPRPTARPSARWVAARARSALAAAQRSAMHINDEPVIENAPLVRSAYARLRRGVLRSGGTAPADAAPWLAELAAWADTLAALDPARARASGRLGLDRVRGGAALPLLAPADLVRWVVALVGPSAAGWPHAAIARAGEARLASALTTLAAGMRPAAWVYRDLDAALSAAEGATRSTRTDTARVVSLRRPSADRVADIAGRALALAAQPPDDTAIELVEADDDSPPSLVAVAARALVTRGETGRALALALRRPLGGAGGLALLAEIKRRAGDAAGAKAAADAALALGDEGDGSASAARATLARMLFDAGDAAAALARAEPLDGPLSCAVGALANAALGDRPSSLVCLERGSALAADAASRALLLGVRGYISAADDPGDARTAFRAAVDEAARAGAVVEEATYLTGAAAAAVDEGHLEEATLLGERASLMWEALGRPAQAARALLARAAAFSTARMKDEARAAALRALEAAEDARDPRAATYALLAAIDVAPPEEVAGLIEGAQTKLATAAGDVRADSLRLAARALEQGLLGGAEVARYDDLAGSNELQAAARLEWWGARARADESLRHTARREEVVRALVTLAEARAEVSARGPALAAGARLAAALGLGDAAMRLRSAVRKTSTALVEASGALMPAVLALEWLDRGSDGGAGSGALEREQVARLEHLVRSLAGNDDLDDLLRQVVDALVAWTGVERGLLLMMRGGVLVPRAARNLAQRDLDREQLALSRSLAGRALERREPVVAVDAAGELPDVHRSVHALRLRSVLAVPLLARGEPLGVVYLDDRVRRGAFGERELAWVRTLASLAAGMIAAAMGEAEAERDARRAERARRVLERTVAERDVRVQVLESELGRVSRSRALRSAFDGIIGESESFVRALRVADRVSTAHIPVLLVGESGSGKELFARAIHEASPRSAAPFVSENCGAIPETLLESTLFGHVRGAFTGADRTRIGLFEAADTGTLFLDEVGEMSLAMQAKLLRILEEGVVRPLGTERTRKVDVRLIAATHRDLEAMVARREFREDLYYRMSIVTLKLPPLRERVEDIPVLVKLFVEKHASGRPIVVTKEALRALTSFAWPGNVRQLENEVRRAIVLGDGTIDLEHLSPEIAAPARAAPVDLGLDVKRRVDRLESDLVREALGRTHNNQTKAAQLLGLSRFGLQKMMKRLAIKAS